MSGYRARYATGYRQSGAYRIGAYGDGLGGVSIPSYIWYSAQNIDGSNNSSLTDGVALATWKNLGSLGSSADLLQATTANKPAFKLVCSAGKLNNKSSVHSPDNVRYMQTGTFTNIPQPFTASLVWASDKVGVHVVADARSPICEIYTPAGAGGTLHFADNADNDSTLVPGANQFGCATFTATGAGSFVRLNGVSSGLMTTQVGFGTVLTLISFLGTQGAVCDILDFKVCPGTVQAIDLEADLAAQYGAFPQ